MISSYNKQGIGDTLMIRIKESSDSQLRVERKGNIAEIKDGETGETVGFNFFFISKLLNLEGIRKNFLMEEQVSLLNTALKKEGFSKELEVDLAPKFVVGFVKECVEHPDSDHLSITQTEVDNGKTIQIVCGASNIAQGQKVVVAKEGAIMPSGMVIWDGELRGEPSHGMICSAKELGLDYPKEEKGILVLPDTVEVGKEFQTEMMASN
ncbi:MAG: DUF4479 and tRNA-binding domain-containing protein [Pisciglobus halotolerans]|nr:DUF4479 and tRNA-binding domain-containing protein [Pisciglobus halotolerans]